MRLTYLGHSVLQLEIGSTSVLVDPFITGNPLAEGVVSVDLLTPDVILLTHAHGDHFGDTPAIVKRTNALVVGDVEVATYMDRVHGHSNCRAMNTGGSWNFDWGRVTMTYASHSSSFPDGSSGGNAHGFIVESNGKVLYIAGDTAPFAEMAWLGDDFDIDIAFLPIGDCFTMGFKGAIRSTRMLKPKVTIPAHYNTFDAVRVDPNEWMGMMNEAKLNARILSPGETINV